MRWVSSRESVRQGEPSVLAIVETLVATGISLWIAVRLGTVTHIVIGAGIAPFLLLRTDESAALGISALRWINAPGPWFETIAGGRGRCVNWLEARLSVSHEKTPSFSLSRLEIANLATYLNSLPREN